MLTKLQLDFLAKYQNIAIACSGGVDSMVLCDILLKHQIDFSVIHCNFQLRGKDSEEDEQFVKSFAAKNNLQFYSTKFDTEKLAKEHKNSIEIEARNLRYQYFDTLANDKSIDLILLAHHKDDHIETLLMRMITGTGLKGLGGIRQYREPRYYRPLWHWTKDKIRSYAKNNELEFCYDITNSENRYMRNRIRNEIIPSIKNINPNYHSSFMQLSEIAIQSQALLQHYFQHQKNTWQTSGIADLSDIAELDFLPLVIAYFLEEYDINKSLIKDIVASIHSKESKYFLFDKGEIELKNKKLYRVNTSSEGKIIYTNKEELLQDKDLDAEMLSTRLKEYDPTYLYLDINKLKFPLLRRQIQSGDKIKALGMKGYKKLSQIAQEQQWTRSQKSRSMVLVDATGEIIALLGWRIADEVKLEEADSSQIIRIRKLVFIFSTIFLSLV